MNDFRFTDRSKQNTTGKTDRRKTKMNIKLGINWTKSGIALALLCAVFSFSAMAQDNPNKPLGQEEVEALINHLKEGLPELIDDEDAVNEIVEKWENREDLAGKIGEQVLKIKGE